MGDSECASYHQHVPSIHEQQHQPNLSHVLQQQHEQQHVQQQQHEQQQQSDVAEIAPEIAALNQITLAWQQFGSNSSTSRNLSNNTASSVATASVIASHVASSSLVTANLQQLSVSSNNNTPNTTPSLQPLAAAATAAHQLPIFQQQQQQPLHQYQYLGRQRSESCAGNFGINSSLTARSHNANNSATSATTSCNSIATTPLLGAIAASVAQGHLSRDLLDSEDEVALQPLSNQVHMCNFIHGHLKAI